jgi:hypothetical protein
MKLDLEEVNLRKWNHVYVPATSPKGNLKFGCCKIVEVLFAFLWNWEDVGMNPV